ncbi:hypothetical protein CDAR_444291 [Caerostris darwini]|uniref:Uncharacterized protein n=1 Tax=Caerostris darwini TaxID=1538125 RepID=A0AAV4X919_9ARAC|nr:hypothetical protein CDAR_444291 [Caerostris darwini]
MRKAAALERRLFTVNDQNSSNCLLKSHLFHQTIKRHLKKESSRRESSVWQTNLVMEVVMDRQYPYNTYCFHKLVL